MKKLLIAFLMIVSATPSAWAVELSLIVTDKNNEPIIGAAVIEQGTNPLNGTVTDLDGRFSLTNIQSDNSVIEISSLGYTTQTYTVSNIPDNIVLEEENTVLDGVVVKANHKNGDKCNAHNINNDIFAINDGDAGKWDKPVLTTKWKCVVEQCVDGFVVDKQLNKCVVDCSKYKEQFHATNMQHKKSVFPTPDTLTSVYSKYCYPTKCNEPVWTRVGNGENAKCESTVGNECKATNAKTAFYDEQHICKVTECISSDYKPNDDETACVAIDTKCDTDAKSIDANARHGLLQDGKCIITDCKKGYNVDKINNKCVACGCNTNWDDATNKCEEITNKDCKNKIPGATVAEYVCDDEKSVCRATECDTAAGYKLTDGTCESQMGKPCTAEQLPENATAGTQRENNGKIECIISECARGFEVRPDKLSCAPKMVLSAEQYQNEIAELADNAQKMHERETSLENRMLGAAGIGAVGIGGTMVGAALAERRADDVAERAMRAYIETFRCDYGAGKNIKGGETNVELPGGNDMIGLYTEYAQIANDLKMRKEALGIRPGIESEVVIDKAETGLYEYNSNGITVVTYASIARALMNPDGEDAKMWAAQREKTNSNLKTGAIVAGVGAATSLVTNIAINHGTGDKSQRIRDQYAPLYQLQTVVSNIPQPTPNCPSEAPGTWPECICTTSTLQFNPNTFKCEPCTGGQVVDTQTHMCKCPSDKPWLSPNGTCSAAPQNCQETCSNDPLIAWDANCNCSCQKGYLFDRSTKTCTCPSDNGYQIDNGVCTKIQVSSSITQSTTDTADITLPAGALFDIGKSTLRDAAKTALTTFVNDVNAMQNISDCKMEIHGYTDPIGTDASNDKLSTDRANAVKNFLTTNNINIRSNNISTKGHGEGECFCNTNNKNLEKNDISCKNGEHLTGNVRYSPCRRVEVKMICKQTTTSTATELQQLVNQTTDAIAKIANNN